MNSLATKTAEVMATDVWFDKNMLCVRLMDGREISAPLEWFPKLRDASDVQRKRWRFIGRGIGIHWKDLDEDIAIETLLK